jgi:hypothetical protein
VQKLLEYDKDKLTDDSLLKKLGKFSSNPDFTPDSVGGWPASLQMRAARWTAANHKMLGVRQG